MYCIVLCQKAKKEIPCFLQSLIQYVTLVGGEGLKEQKNSMMADVFFVYPFIFFNIIFYDCPFNIFSSFHHSHVRNNSQAVKYSISRLILCNSPLKYSCRIFIICGFWSNFVLLFFKINYFWKSKKKKQRYVPT